MTELSQFERVVEIAERSDTGSVPTKDEVDFLVEVVRQAAQGLEYESRRKLVALVDRAEVIGRLAEKAMVRGDEAGLSSAGAYLAILVLSDHGYAERAAEAVLWPAASS